MSVHTTNYVIPGQITSCRLGSTLNIPGIYDNGQKGIGATITTFSPTLIVDLVEVDNGDSIYVANQTNRYEDGIYVVSGVGTQVVLTRRADLQSPSQMVPGYFFTLSAGSFSGWILTVTEPQVQEVGVDYFRTANSTGGGSIPPTSVNLNNNGLNIYNPAHTFLNNIVPTSPITANRQFSLVTADQNTSLDLSQFPNFAPTAFGGVIVESTDNVSAQSNIGIFSGLLGPVTVTGLTYIFPVPDMTSTDIVVAQIATSGNTCFIVNTTPLNGNLSISFDSIPGSNTSIFFVDLSTV